ncbi:MULTISPECIES: MarR family transcriptional regulator [Oceanithermus]|uniref:MarR family transcriptional regulator n=2 Tax=Bacteria TaxID=2 RepID=A0A7C5MZ99_9GAMM|nr:MULTISPECIES: MarR family transcriptional regulator [Oceanithermus]MBB6028759.1 DNA-binding MarR family transcriptional regulator [Oceanithermus desulfurans]HHH13102.1 MarR family transcriptional regulator [Thiolapillus brandeum]
MEAWPLLTRIWKLQRALAQEAAPCIGEYGLNPKELMLLAFVEKRPHAGQLARELHLPAPSVTHALKRLEKAGLIVREHDPEDLRRFLFTLTPRGQEALEAGRGCLVERLRDRLVRLAPEERATLIALLDRMLEEHA